jgi:hypothetical protein
MSASDAGRIAACRLFLRAASDPGRRCKREEVEALVHAGIDWDWLAGYLCGSGLARPLLGVLNDPELTGVVPAHVGEAISRRGVFGIVRERLQRDAIARIEEALRGLGGRGVLLKGCAFLMRAPRPGAARGTSDVDIFVEPALAARLRSHLLARGFDGAPEAGPSTFQHLAPIAYRSVAIEIHTRIMAGFWGLPEREMLADARPVAGSNVLATLSPAGLILHSAVHMSASFFSFGLKTAWDLLAVLRTEPDVDWPRLLSWVSTLRAPRSFWAPVCALTEGLDLPMPSTFLQYAPSDRGARRSEAVARHRLFTAAEGLLELDVVTKTGLVLLLFDSWSARAGYLGAKLHWRGSRPSTWSAAVLRARRADVLRQAWQQYRRYRHR